MRRWLRHPVSARGFAVGGALERRRRDGRNVAECRQRKNKSYDNSRQKWSMFWEIVSHSHKIATERRAIACRYT